MYECYLISLGSEVARGEVNQYGVGVQGGHFARDGHILRHSSNVITPEC